MKIVGLDLSLTSTGLAAVCDNDTIPRWYAVVDRIQTKPNGDELADRIRRLDEIVDGVHGWVHDAADLVVVEGLAYASKSPHATERAGLWWLVVSRLLHNGYPLAVVSPTARAKYATGKGNAAKDAVLAGVIRRYPDVDITGNDEADALILAAMGARHRGHPIDDLPASHLDAMAKVAWPEPDGSMQ